MTIKQSKALTEFLIHMNKDRFSRDLGYRDFSKGKNKVVDLLIEELKTLEKRYAK